MVSRFGVGRQNAKGAGLEVVVGGGVDDGDGGDPFDAAGPDVAGHDDADRAAVGDTRITVAVSAATNTATPINTTAKLRVKAVGEMRVPKKEAAIAAAVKGSTMYQSTVVVPIVRRRRWLW